MYWEKEVDAEHAGHVAAVECKSEVVSALPS